MVPVNGVLCPAHARLHSPYGRGCACTRPAPARPVRRSAAAVMTVIMTIVVPFFLAFTDAVPTVIGEWLLRITPAAAFAVQQSTPQYHQVQAAYTPAWVTAS